MIVFPLRRSVGLKAATASSRAATLPMFVRSRPSRTRWTSSLNWARSGTTTKSIVRPPEGRAVHEDALPRTKAAVLEQPLPRGQARHHEGRTHGEVNVARQRCEVACLDGYILRQRAVASPVREAEHPLSHRQPRRSIAEGGAHSGQLVAGDRRRPVTA